jgi:ribosome assembly protein 4
VPITTTVRALLHQKQRDDFLDVQVKQGRRVRPQDVEKIEFKAPEEETVMITYRPQATFRVRAVSRCAAALDGHSQAVLVVAFSPDGRVLASGGGDNEIRIWDIQTKTPIETLQAHRHWVQVLSWSPDGKYLASGSRDGGLICWRHEGYSNWRPTTLSGHSNFLSHISWEPLHRNALCERFVSASKDATLKVWGRTGVRFALSGHTSCVTCVVWGGEGRIFSTSQDRQILVWSDVDGAQLARLSGHGHWVNFVTLSCEHVLRTGAHDHTEQEFSTPELASAYARKRYDAVLQRSGGERMISCSDDNTMFLWAVGENPAQGTKQLSRLVGHQGPVIHVAFSPDGAYIASCSADKSVRIWSATDGKFICTFRGHVGAVYRVVWSLDSRMVVSASRDSTVKLWSITTRALVEDLNGHADEVYALDWNPTGSACVASGSKDKQLRIWVH